MTVAEALDLAQFAGAAMVGAVGAVIGMYRIFVPRPGTAERRVTRSSLSGQTSAVRLTGHSSVI